MRNLLTAHRAGIARSASAIGFILVSAAVLALGLREPLAPFVVLVLQPLLLLLAALGFTALGMGAGRHDARAPRRARAGAARRPQRVMLRPWCRCPAGALRPTG